MYRTSYSRYSNTGTHTLLTPRSGQSATASCKLQLYDPATGVRAPLPGGRSRAPRARDCAARVRARLCAQPHTLKRARSGCTHNRQRTIQCAKPRTAQHPIGHRPCSTLCRLSNSLSTQASLALALSIDCQQTIGAIHIRHGNQFSSWMAHLHIVPSEHSCTCCGMAPHHISCTSGAL